MWALFGADRVPERVFLLPTCGVHRPRSERDDRPAGNFSGVRPGTGKKATVDMETSTATPIWLGGAVSEVARTETAGRFRSLNWYTGVMRTAQ